MRGRVRRAGRSVVRAGGVTAGGEAARREGLCRGPPRHPRQVGPPPLRPGSQYGCRAQHRPRDGQPRGGLLETRIQVISRTMA